MKLFNWLHNIYNNSSLNDVSRNKTENKNTEHTKPTIRKIRDSDGNAIIQLAMDHMQRKIYAIREKLGILRCSSLHNCNDNTTMLITNSQNFIQSIAVDSWNGSFFKFCF